MVKRFLAALLALAYCNAVFAQSIGGFVVPPDLRSQPGGGYSAVTPTYKTDGTANTPIDPNVTAPPQVGLTNIPVGTSTGRVQGSDGTVMCPTTYSTTTNNATASISGTTMTVTAVSGGTIMAGEQVTGSGVSGSTFISALGTGTGGTGTYTVSNSQTVASEAITIAPCQQAKFRTIIGSTHSKVLCDDPIRNYGQPGLSHCHLFFGNIQANAFSTYTSLRTASQSDASGYDINGTGYWFPAVYKSNPFSDGHNYALRPNYEIVYYLEDSPAFGPTTAYLPPGMRYVFLYEMDDQWAWLQTIADSANTTSGSHRYSLILPETQITGSISGTTLTVTAQSGVAIRIGYRLDGVGLLNDTEIVGLGTGTGGTGTYTVSKSQTIASESMTQGRMGAESFYSCVHSGVTTSVKVLNANGSDPFGGNCASGDDLYVNVSGPDCWDRTNLWSPGGYKHVIPEIYDTVAGGFVCPTNFSLIPTIQMEIHFATTGPTDYMNWRLSSDDSRATACSCTVLNGTTYHTDWDNGWDNVFMLQWEQNGIGAMNHTPHELNSSAFANGQHFIGGYAGEIGPLFNPQVDQSLNHYPSTSAGNMIMLPSTHNGPKTMNMHQ